MLRPCRWIFVNVGAARSLIPVVFAPAALPLRPYRARPTGCRTIASRARPSGPVGRSSARWDFSTLLRRRTDRRGPSPRGLFPCCPWSTLAYFPNPTAPHHVPRLSPSRAQPLMETILDSCLISPLRSKTAAIRTPPRLPHPLTSASRVDDQLAVHVGWSGGRALGP